jgi:hypothetical protein
LIHSIGVNGSVKPFLSIEDEVNSVLNPVFIKNKNCLIEYSKSANNSSPYCIIYFSSDFIFYPYTREAFLNQIVKQDRYEWYHTRIDCGTKHIFLRDIKKRHYLCGINSNLDTMEKILDFLKSETEGYKIITLGSSSGGYAAVFFGQKLKAERIYSFNGQFVLDDRYNWFFTEKEKSLAREHSNFTDYLKEPSTIFYFHSNKSEADKAQFKYVEHIGINVLSFNTSVHGIPFLKNNLPVVINLNINDLKVLSNKSYDPLFFSIKMVGVFGLLIGIYKQIRELLSQHILLKTIRSALFQ